MGLQSENSVQGASVLVIDQLCDNDQLLVSLSKNEAQWLSPIGWTDQQKVTLLDCRSNGNITEIDIPTEFAGDIKTGDVLVLRCSELDFEKEIIWEASSVETRNASENTSEAIPAVTGLAGGLLSRFKTAKSEPVEEIKSDAQRRAEDADRAAQGYKAKMEAATAAKEEAQRKALDAAREAEAALKMEAERIAEMERAAKAFEEAERLKQDEMRRVEEERRAEEARLAEEARRIEEAHKREIAAKKEAERKAALERYEAALDITRNEELRLASRLKDLKQKAKTEAANVAVQAEDLKSRQGLLVTTEEAVSKRFGNYEKNASKLDVLNAELTLLQTESESLTADRQALSIRLAQADKDYQHAQAEAEAAMARAEALRTELDVIRQDESDVSGKISSVSEKLSSQSHIVAEASDKTQKLQAKYEAAQAELAQARIETEVLEQTLVAEAEKEQNLRLEIEATQQAVEDSQMREALHREAITHLEAGGAPEDIAEVNFEARNFEASYINLMADESDLTALTAETNVPKKKMLGRVRRSFARDKDAEISIDVEDVVLNMEKVEADPVILAGIDDTPSLLRRHGSSLMALGAVIGGVALLSGGYAINKSSKPKLSVKSSTPAQKQVLSAVTKVELPKPIELKAAKVTETPKVPEIVKTAEKTTEKITELAKPTLDTTAIDFKDAEAIEATPVVEDAIPAAGMKEDLLIVKLAEIVDPTGFAFELPDMMPIAQPEKTKSKAASKKAETPKAKKPTPQKLEVKKPEVTKTAEVTAVKPVTAPKVEAEVNYPELTSDVQTRLSKLGFYTGEIDGLKGTSTKEAISSFKTLFAVSETSGKITGEFLTELKRVEADQKIAESKALDVVEPAVEAEAVQLAEATPSVELYDTVQAVPSTPVVTDSLPAASEIVPAVDPAPAYVAPEPEPVKVASISAVTEPASTPIAQDVIVEARLTRNASAKYPSSAERREYFVNVAIVVEYDIDASGRATNIRIASNDHKGRFVSSFEKEAMNAIRKLRYEPKTVNGEAVETSGNQKRIVFRAE